MPCTPDSLDVKMSTESSTSQVSQHQPVNTTSASIQNPGREPTAAIPSFSYAQAAKGRMEPLLPPTSADKVSYDSSERESKATVSVEQDAGSTSLCRDPEALEPQSRARSGKSEEIPTNTGNVKEGTNSDASLKPKDESLPKSASVPSSPEYGTTSTSTLPKEEDIFSTGNGSSDSTWDKQSQSSQNGIKTDEKKYAEKELSSSTAWDEEAAAAPVLKEAPPPVQNVWQQRKEAQEAKTKAKQPATQQLSTSSSNNSGQVSVNTGLKGSDAAVDSKKQEHKRKSKAAADEKLVAENARGLSKDRKSRSSEDGTRYIQQRHRSAQLIFMFPDKSTVLPMSPLPPPGDAVSWPTPNRAGGEEKKKPQERSDEGEKEKEGAHTPKASGKKAWTPVPFVPTAVFNTPLPQARRGGRGPSGGCREGAPRGRTNMSTNNGSEKLNNAGVPTAQTPILSSDKGRANGNSLPANYNASKPKRASSAGPISAKEQRKPGDAAGDERRKDGTVDDVKINQTRRTSVHDSRRPQPAPIPATPQVGRAAGRAPVNDSMPSTSQTPSRSYEHQKQSQTDASEGTSHPRNAVAERRSEGSIRSHELPKDFHGGQSNRERGEERAGRGRGGHRGRGNANNNAYNGHLPNGYGYTNSHSHQYQQPLASQSRSFSNHERIPSQSQGSFFGPSSTYRSLRSASRSQYSSAFVSPGGRFSHGTNQGPSHLPSIQTDLANMSALQNGAQGIMTAIPFDDPYMQQITLFDMVTTQMEYYFSLDNLCKDMFLRKHMDSQGYVFLSVLAGFNRIVQLTTDVELIRYVCLNSQKIEFKPGSLWQDGRDRLRAREDWDKFVLAKEQRDPSAQVDAPTPAQSYQITELASGFDERHGVSPGSSTANGPVIFPYQSLDAIAPPSNIHAAAATSSTNGTYANAYPTPLSAAVSEFAPSVHTYSSRRYPSPDPRSYETKTFTDEEMQKLHIFVRQPIHSSLPPFHSASSRTFSNGSIDGRNINDELSKSVDRQARPINGEVFESADRQRSARSRSPFIVGSPTGPPDTSRSPPVFWAKTKDSALNSLPSELALESYLDFRRDALKEREQVTPGKPFSNMQNLYNFWSHFLIRNFNAPMYEEFRRLAFEDASIRGSNMGMQSLMQYYDEALLGHRPLMDDSIALHYVEIVQSENRDQERPAFNKLRASWRNGAFNHKNRHKIMKVIDPKLREELDR
ncbi:MAG: hypothetical protein Q9163_000898 [Psora crenata]